jgi:hypothetical protein
VHLRLPLLWKMQSISAFRIREQMKILSDSYFADPCFAWQWLLWIQNGVEQSPLSQLDHPCASFSG